MHLCWSMHLCPLASVAWLLFKHRVGKAIFRGPRQPGAVSLHLLTPLAVFCPIRLAIDQVG